MVAPGQWRIRTRAGQRHKPARKAVRVILKPPPRDHRTAIHVSPKPQKKPAQGVLGAIFGVDRRWR